MSIFGKKVPQPGSSSRSTAAALSRADAAIAEMDEVAASTRSLTKQLKSIYEDKGSQGLRAYVSDVTLAEQLSREARLGLK